MLKLISIISCIYASIAVLGAEESADTHVRSTSIANRDNAEAITEQVALVPLPSIHLEPAESYFSSYDFEHEYHTRVREILLRGISDSPLAQVVYLPLHAPESAMVIQWADKEEPVLMYLVCSQAIWRNSDYGTVEVLKYSRVISGEFARTIQELWIEGLGTTRYPKELNPRLEGTTYYLSSFQVRKGLRSAQTRSPKEDSVPFKLLMIADSLLKIIDLQPGSEEEKLISYQAKSLLSRIEDEANNTVKTIVLPPPPKAKPAGK